MADSRLILHVKGTESQTTQLPKNIVRAGIAQGEITRSQLIWSVAHNAWKQVRELPHLLPSQKLAPAPAPRVGTTTLPKPVEAVRVPSGTVPRVVAKAAAGTPVAAGTPTAAGARGAAKPTVKAVPAGVKPAVAKPATHAGPATGHVVKEQSGFPYLMWLCIILALIILAALGSNYLLVDRPLASGMSQTAYANVPVYAHLGAFVQPGAMVIHIPTSPSVTSDNLAEFLQTLARNSPANPLSKDPFDVVSLTTGWTGHYSFTGDAWKEFGDMSDQDATHKKTFLLDHLKDASGESLVSPDGALDAETQESERNKVWAEFVAYFTK